MAFDFGFSLYFLDPPELTAVEQFFVQVQGKINIYRQHAETTIKLYHTEANEKLKAQKEEFKEAMKVADLVYEKVYLETGGSENDRDAYAMHESGIQEIEHHYATADEHLKTSFMGMADHYNKSSVVTLYALLETELRRLCGHLHSAFSLRFTVERFEKTDYLKSIIEYISLVADLDITIVEPKMNRLQELQFLRNKIMHNGAEFTLEANPWLEDLVNSSNGGLFWEEIPEEQLHVLRVRSKFIVPYYTIVSDFFFDLFSSLNLKLQFTILTNRISFLFGFLTRGAVASYISHRNVANGRQFIFLIKSPEGDNGFTFNCKITVTTANVDQVVITNQLDVIDKMERWVEQMNENPAVLRRAIVGYLNPNKAHKIEIMLYP
ncbi:hypothetical protein [Pedobacter sp. D749]|uniref:hypothetical protein n=1 Tax=Pedobacter sp. D749 TaxID=2856523 RepID=UPI001C57CB11|nr:hypothetical protein [Pedobacter sp. D749]QXU42846.1 hypothetical protein KYH19_04400 [Pedobacter sp. D749]